MSCPIDHSNLTTDSSSDCTGGNTAHYSTGRIASSIPKSGTEHTWLYPSPDQFHAAMQRKGHQVHKEDISTILLMHNVVNEQCWQQVSRWERDSFGNDTFALKRFQGRPDKLSPKAWLKSKILGYVRPFDRHDWIVERKDGAEVRYVIDFYSGRPSDTGQGQVSVYLDVRPALDSPRALIARLNNWFQTKRSDWSK